jgi:hypothetical protein
MKKNYIFVLAIISTFLSCAKEEEVPHFIDPWFEPYIQQFKQDVTSASMSEGAFDSITVMKFGNVAEYGKTTKTAWATCTYLNLNRSKLDNIDFEKAGIPDSVYHTFYKVIIFSDEIKLQPKNIQYEVFLHEIGHCAYHLKHKDSNPPDIMNSSGFSFEDKDWPNLLNEYFEEAKENQSNWFSEVQPEN